MPAEGARATDAHKPFESSSDASAWLHRYGDALYRYAAARVGGREPAEDLVQDCLETRWFGSRSEDAPRTP